MNRKNNILSVSLLLMVAAGCFQSCQQDDFGEVIPDKETLIAQGRYLTARSSDGVTALDDPDKASWFESGTPYRLLAFTKPYKGEVTTPTLRFNKVAWEGVDDGTGLHFINIDNEPDKWFGFSALNGETAGEDGLVSLDFYGFTYGKKAKYDISYIQLEEPAGVQTPDKEKLGELTHKEDVSDYSSDKKELLGDLNDLMWGHLLNQNIETAGANASNATQSIIPFIHAFSRLRFMVVQQSEDNPDENGNAGPCFPDVWINSIKVTNTYGSGSVYLQDGKIKLNGNPTKRNLNISKEYTEKYPNSIPLQQVEIGQMLIYPSDGNCLKDMPDRYDVGLEISVTGKDKATIEHFLANTNPEETSNDVTGSDNDGWTGTVVKNSIIDNYTNEAIRFKQNTAYTLVISFQKNSVRIITVIPQVEEWLPGEFNEETKEPWQEQALGQPQMFDNIVWSDRNLGAEYHDPSGQYYEQAVGYFYQPGRNIPYYPFKYLEYSGYDAAGNKKKPDLKDIHSQDLSNSNTAYNGTVFRFYPVVDDRLLKMTGSDDWAMDKNYTPQMIIPESCPTDNIYFNFLKGTDSGNTGLTDAQNMKWEEGQQNQPVSGAWVIPSSKDFLTIFPSTPHAGNITFRTGGYNSSPMSWNPGAMSEDVKVLRVTVPYYDTKECDKPWKKNPSEMYTKAWNTLKDNLDPGSTIYIPGTNIRAYTTSPGYAGNPNYEPDGDPEDGFASVYVISRDGDDLVEPDILKSADLSGKNWAIKSWGTIYAIKRIYTSQAYRMRWRVLSSSEPARNPCFYVEICRYRCNADSKLTVDNYKSYDWDHYAAKLYFPICGLGDWTGQYINFGTECEYATSDRISDGKTSSVQIKVSGNDAYNAYIAVITNVINRNFGLQIRPIGGGK